MKFLKKSKHPFDSGERMFFRFSKTSSLWKFVSDLGFRISNFSYASMFKNRIVITLVLLATAGWLAGCASSSRPAEDQPFSESEGSLSDDATGETDEAIYDSAVSDKPLPARPEGANPSTADYETLKAHTVYFGFDSFSIVAGERHKVENVARWMKEHPKKYLIIAGHCDERGTTEYNLALGERRALSVRDYLVGLGADRAKISTVSYGEEKPEAIGTDETTWKKNRRAEIGVLK